MSIKVILFDLDGTLLPMDQNVFVKSYFGGLAKKLAPHGYDSEKLISAVWAGTGAMVKNDGTKKNEEVFWDKFCEIFGEEAKNDLPIFEEFYATDFAKVQSSCGYNPKASETVRDLKNMGLRIALATNPIFPEIATRQRIAWAGLDTSDFELYTTYENSRYCKPNLEYYKDITNSLGVEPCECLMVGNDVDEDMIAEKLSMKVFLVTECIINKSQKDISLYPNGDFSDLMNYVRGITK
jgi:FMN phosphatase YigB (HAD superfamily)